MKIENPLTVLLKDKKVQKGDQMILQFKMPEIESNIYGDIDDLCGEIPFILKYGDCPISPFYDLSELEQEKYNRKYSEYIKTVNEDLDDEAIRNYVISMITCCICYGPHLIPGTPEFDLNVKYIISCLKTDDIVDSEEFYGKKFDYHKVLSIMTKGLVEAKNGNPGPMLKAKRLLPPLENYFNFFFTKGRENDSDSNWEIDPKRYWEYDQLSNLMSSQFIMFSKESLKNMNRYNKMLIGGVNKGVVLLGEWHAADSGIVVDRNIRESFLFKQMMDCFYILTACKNDIRGLVKDIRNGEVINNSILSWINPEEGRDFRYCFNDTLGRIKENTNMFLTYAQLLEISFPQEKGLKDYIHLLKVMLDGEMFMYFGFSYMDLRYGAGGEYSIV